MLTIRVKIPYKDEYKEFKDIKNYSWSDDFFPGNVPDTMVEKFLEIDYYDEMPTNRIVATRNDNTRLVIDFNTRAFIDNKE